MHEEPYKLWQKAIAAGLGLAFAAGAAVMLGVLTQTFPQDKDKGKDQGKKR